MPGRVLILGGYGNFGKRITSALALKDVPVIIAGRTREKADALVAELPAGLAQAVSCDATQPIDPLLDEFRPAVVINTVGPFQMRDYAIAEACIRNKVHYVDLADGRDFVTGIASLDRTAREAGVSVISGASTVPGLSSAVVEHFRGNFSRIDSLRYGISPGQKAERGLATTQGILSYAGKPLKPYPGARGAVYGWQDIYRQSYPRIGKRWMANCDIPDLDLFPEAYDIGSIRFSAGLELGLLHLGLWGLSWLVRLGAPLRLENHARFLLTASNWFDRFGSPDGGMHVILEGLSKEGEPLKRKWFIVALGGDGPHIPTVPSILLAQRLANGAPVDEGAMPCLGLVTLEDYLEELEPYRVETFTS